MHLPSPRRPLQASRISDPARGRIAHIEGGAPARVHSVFRSVLNVDVDGRLLTLAAASVGGLPNGMLVSETTPLPDLRGLALRPGAPVLVEHGALLVPSAGLAVDLRDARSWSPRLSVHDGRAWPQRSRRAWAVARSHSTPGGIATIAGAETPLTALRAAIAAGDRSAAVHGARPLIGLGPGLTPSGDDVLAGIEAALRSVGHPLGGFLAAHLRDIEERTTTISAALLRHAADGEFAERIGAVTAAFLDGSDDELPRAIERAVAWGATSGSDTLHGILVGLDAATSVEAVAA